jgi:hypothetical protein
MIHYTESSFGFSYVSEDGKVIGIDAGAGIILFPISDDGKESLIKDCMIFFMEDRDTDTDTEKEKAYESIHELLDF